MEKSEDLAKRAFASMGEGTEEGGDYSKSTDPAVVAARRLKSALDGGDPKAIANAFRDMQAECAAGEAPMTEGESE